MRIKLFDTDFIHFRARFLAAMIRGDEVVLPPTRERYDQLTEEPEAPADIEAPLPTPQALRQLALNPSARVTFFTSGSTGQPKRINHTLYALLQEAEGHLNHPSRHASIALKPTILSTVSHQHFYGLVHQVLFPLLAQLPVDPHMIRSPEELEQALATHTPSILLATPTFLRAILAYQDCYQFSDSLCDIVSSGALLETKTAEATRVQFGISPFEIFGATEVGGVAWRRQSEQSLWSLMPQVDVRVNAESALEVRSPMTDAPTFVTMGDGVKLSSDGSQFELLGRLDRLIKLFEERVSLPEEESKLLAHPWITDGAYGLLEVNSLGIVLVPSHEGIEALRTQGRKAFLATLRHAGIRIPKRVRIESELTRNPQGKLLAQVFKAYFEKNIPSPLYTCVEQTEERVQLKLFFPSESVYFTGHFKAFPILPGVIQFYFATHFAHRYLNFKAPLTKATRVKFTHPILPNQWQLLTLTKTSDTSCKFSYSGAEDKCLHASGNLTLEETSC